MFPCKQFLEDDQNPCWRIVHSFKYFRMKGQKTDTLLILQLSNTVLAHILHCQNIHQPRGASTGREWRWWIMHDAVFCFAVLHSHHLSDITSLEFITDRQHQLAAQNVAKGACINIQELPPIKGSCGLQWCILQTTEDLLLTPAPLFTLKQGCHIRVYHVGCGILPKQNIYCGS